MLSFQKCIANSGLFTEWDPCYPEPGWTATDICGNVSTLSVTAHVGDRLRLSSQFQSVVTSDVMMTHPKSATRIVDKYLVISETIIRVHVTLNMIYRQITR
jgi:hypothetical protein